MIITTERQECLVSYNVFYTNQMTFLLIHIFFPQQKNIFFEYAQKRCLLDGVTTTLYAPVEAYQQPSR